MADDSTGEATEGTILHGADGSVYFVPSDALAGYRLDGDEAQAALDAAAGADVSGFSFTPESATDPKMSPGPVVPIFQRLKIADTSGGGGNYQYQKFTAG